jgi:hypothetical protein
VEVPQEQAVPVFVLGNSSDGLEWPMKLDARAPLRPLGKAVKDKGWLTGQIIAVAKVPQYFLSPESVKDRIPITYIDCRN